MVGYTIGIQSDLYGTHGRAGPAEVSVVDPAFSLGRHALSTPSKMLIYELHVKGFTAAIRNATSARGDLCGLMPAVIDYL